MLYYSTSVFYSDFVLALFERCLNSIKFVYFFQLLRLYSTNAEEFNFKKSSEIIKVYSVGS